jgi:hypothetical protein
MVFNLYNAVIGSVFMSVTTIRLRGDLKDVLAFVKDILREANFVIIDEEDLSDGFHVLSVDKKRMSLMTITLLSLIGGHIPTKRVALDLTAHEKGGFLTAVLKCTLYIDTVDMEATVETPQERERCEKLAKLFIGRIIEEFDRVP